MCFLISWFHFQRWPEVTLYVQVEVERWLLELKTDRQGVHDKFTLIPLNLSTLSAVCGARRGTTAADTHVTVCAHSACERTAYNDSNWCLKLTRIYIFCKKINKIKIFSFLGGILNIATTTCSKKADFWFCQISDAVRFQSDAAIFRSTQFLTNVLFSKE